MFLIKNLTKIYMSKGEKTKALQNINLSLPDKGLVFITGRSGSGKSTLLNIIGGLDKLTEGSLTYNGIALNKLSEAKLAKYRNKYVGFVFQDFALIETMTVHDNVAISLEMQSKKDEKFIDEVLENLKIKELKDRIVTKLSAGQKQRVAIARAIVKKPQVILCDEPTGNLDSESGKIILDFLYKMANDKLVVIISHNKNEAFNFANRIIELEKGKIIKDLTCSVNNRECVISNGTLYLNDVKTLSKENKYAISNYIQRGYVRQIESSEALFYPNHALSETSQDKANLEKTKGLNKKLKLFKNILGKNIFKSIVFSCVSMIILSVASLFQSFEGLNEEDKVIESVNNSEIDSPVIIAYQKEGDSILTGYVDKLSDEQLEVISQYDAYYVADVGVARSLFDNTGERAMLYSPEQSSVHFYANLNIAGTVFTNESFLKKIFKLGGDLEIYKAKEIKPEGVYITDYAADSLIYTQKTYTYDQIVGEQSNFSGYINGIINTEYKEKFGSLLKAFTESKEIDKDELARFIDYKFSYLDKAYSFLDIDTFYDLYLESPYYKRGTFNTIQFEASYNDQTIGFYYPELLC